MTKKNKKIRLWAVAVHMPGHWPDNGVVGFKRKKEAIRYLWSEMRKLNEYAGYKIRKLRDDFYHLERYPGDPEYYAEIYEDYFDLKKEQEE